MKWYIIMKHTYSSATCKKSRLGPTKDEYAEGDGSQGTNGNPDNHFPSVSIKMHELQKAEQNPCVEYRVHTTNY